jgi:hypothetical protein
VTVPAGLAYAARVTAPAAAPSTIGAVSSTGARLGEAVAVAVAGGVIGGGLGWLLHPVVGVLAGTVAALNGAVSGWRGTYAWRRPVGWLAFVLDSTWATLPMTFALVAHAVAAAQHGGGHVPELGHRQNRHVYRRGACLKRGYAFTIGNVISAAGDIDKPRRRRLITDHEDVHVWQSRWFGSIYPICYGLWSAGGVLGGVVTWLRRGRREPLGKVIESCSYYSNPFEWWAYSRDDHWPPGGKVAGLGWQRAAVKPLASLRRRRP